MPFEAMTVVLGSIIETIPLPVFVKDEAHRWVLVNDRFCRFIGHPREDLLGRSDHDLLPERQAEVSWSTDDSVFATGALSESEERITDGAGREHVVISRKMLHPDVGGRRFLVGTIVDITERKLAEHGLEVSEAQYRRLFEAAKDGILILENGTGKIIDVNPFVAQLTGYPREHFLGKQLWDIGPFKDVAASKASFAELQTREYVRYDDLPLQASDGRRIDVEFISNIYRVDDRFVIQCNIRDITGRKKLEEQLRMAQRLEAIGSLAGGVAHDFNNLLSVILSYNEFALEQAGGGGSLRDDLLQVKGAAERAAALTRQLLAFSRKQVLQPVSLSLNQVVQGVEKMLRRVLGEDIDMRLTLAPDLGLTLTDPSQVEQVLMNLVVNARDAMPQGGTLDIETSDVEVDEVYASNHLGMKPGAYVLLAVTDTGTGMDGPTKARIFEPFFTTKEPGKGTGLGLSTVYGIVKQSGGNVWVYSELGQGTTFKVYLPRQPSTATATDLGSLAAPSQVTGTETVLVAEDEEALRQIARRTLESAGYTVLTADDGEEAVAICASYPGEVHLLLTDVVMKRMSGGELAKALTGSRPGLRVLFMSGYTDEAIGHHGVLEAGTRFLAKPFTAAQLKWKVRQVLDGAAGGVGRARE